MRNICSVCGTEKKYDFNRSMYKRCGPCNSRKVLRYYYNNKDLVSEKNKIFYQNNKEYFREYNNLDLSSNDLSNVYKYFIILFG